MTAKILMFALFCSLSVVAAEEPQGLPDPPAKVIFNIGNPEAEIYGLSKYVEGVPTLRDLDKLKSGIYTSLDCNIPYATLMQPEFTAGLNEVMKKAADPGPDSGATGCDCFVKASQNCGAGNYCISTSYSQLEGVSDRMCSCTCSNGPQTYGGCINGGEGEATVGTF